MCIVIINSLLCYNKFCSVFSAKNTTVNDASGVTMLSVRNFSRGGDDFGVPGEQQQCATCVRAIVSCNSVFDHWVVKAQKCEGIRWAFLCIVQRNCELR